MKYFYYTAKIAGIIMTGVYLLSFYFFGYHVATGDKTVVIMLVITTSALAVMIGIAVKFCGFRFNLLGINWLWGASVVLLTTLTTWVNQQFHNNLWLIPAIALVIASVGFFVKNQQYLELPKIEPA